jgi:hypothetical protein
MEGITLLSSPVPRTWISLDVGSHATHQALRTLSFAISKVSSRLLKTGLSVDGLGLAEIENIRNDTFLTFSEFVASIHFKDTSTNIPKNSPTVLHSGLISIALKNVTYPGEQHLQEGITFVLNMNATKDKDLVTVRVLVCVFLPYDAIVLNHLSRFRTLLNNVTGDILHTCFAGIAAL